MERRRHADLFVPMRALEGKGDEKDEVEERDEVLISAHVYALEGKGDEKDEAEIGRAHV